MRVFSLFSGIGGFDLAFQRLNHSIVGACEIDVYARRIYEKHFPETRIWKDATKINPTELPNFECLCAGFPCQAFSIAGNRRGFEDTRGSLFFEIARIAKEKRPRYLLLENVKGLLNHDTGKTFRTIISTLDEMGYDAEWQVLNSKYFVPQNRERVFIIGHLRGKSRRKIFPLGDNNSEASKSSKPNESGLIAVTKDHDKLRDTQNQSLAIDANYWKGPDNHGQRTMIYMAHSQGNIRQRIQDRKEIWTLSNNASDFGVIEPAIIADRSRSYAGKGRSLESPKNISNSLTSVTKDNYLIRDARIRRLTPKECERLQGFPDNWTKYDVDGAEISDTQRYKMCGNAITVPVVKYIAENFE